MKLDRIALGLTAIVLMVLMVSTARACVGPGLTPGFWKHNVGVYLTSVNLPGGNGAYSDPGVTWYGDTDTIRTILCTKDTMGAWLHLHWTDAELQVLYGQLSTIGGGAAGALTRNTAANVFNEMADLYDL